MCRQGKWALVSNHKRKVKCSVSSYLTLNKFTLPDNHKILTSESKHLSIYGNRNKQRDGAKRRKQRGKRKGRRD